MQAEKRQPSQDYNSIYTRRCRAVYGNETQHLYMTTGQFPRCYGECLENLSCKYA